MAQRFSTAGGCKIGIIPSSFGLKYKGLFAKYFWKK